MYRVILEDKESEIVKAVAEFSSLCPNFTSIFTNYEDVDRKYHHDNIFSERFKNVKCENKINGIVEFSERKDNLMKYIMSYSKKLIRTYFDVEFDKEGCSTIEAHSIIVGKSSNLTEECLAHPFASINGCVVHPFASVVHSDSEEYGINTFSVLYYYDIDTTIKGGELVIMKDENTVEEEINILPTENQIKIILLNNGVSHKVNDIRGFGHRNILGLFIGLEDSCVK